MDELEKLNLEVEELRKLYCREEKEKEKKITTLITKNDYIKWLEKFTEKYPLFDDELITSESDKINIGNLGLFYRGIQRYASKNYIEPIHDVDSNYYVIIFNDITYIIGEKLNFERHYYCRKTETNANAISFMDILCNKEQTRAILINRMKENDDYKKIK